LLNLLTPKDRAALEELFQDRRVFGTTIAQILNSWGPKLQEEALKAKKPEEKRSLEFLANLCTNMGGGTIQRHRRGMCHCSKVT